MLKLIGVCTQIRTPLCIVTEYVSGELESNLNVRWLIVEFGEESGIRDHVESCCSVGKGYCFRDGSFAF